MNILDQGVGEGSPVQRWYDGRTVLVTGGTGFMGKVLVEKLLRSTSVAVIYLLVRPKKGKSVQQRFSELLQDAIFSKLKDKDIRRRVIAVEGDTSALGLGLSPKDAKLLREEVEIVFHSAATVRFDEALSQAIATNVRGTKFVIELARECPRLKAFVHISTAYANCTQNEIEEDFFEPPISGDKAISLSECLTEKQLSEISTTLCGEYPNTYAFTKAIAENVINVYGKGLPAVVFRPSIVVATAREPIYGWIDNMYGPTGVQCGVGAGLLRTFEVNEKCAADLVPVDMAVNAIIASAWDVRDTKEMRVYNYVSSCQNPIYWGQFIEVALRHGRDNPTVKAIWWYTISTTKVHLLYLMYQWLLHLIPALCIDMFLVVTGKKPKLWSVYKKVHKFTKVITYFSKRQWLFHNDRMIRLWDSLDPQDKEIFNFDISALDWDDFLKNTITGLRCNFFKDKPDTLPAAKRKQFMFFIVHQLLKFLLIGGVIWLFWKIFSTVLSI
ncbi:fatty acyl-CoA reductase wat-like isoform X2 [Macrosteles quadrilineatus]|nr:fatty acyl-CoA reductase wat-like isoform X2 [Macrosteles quadrilineatus]